MKRLIIWIWIPVLLLASCNNNQEDELVPLTGTWHFQLMPENQPMLPFTGTLEEKDKFYTFIIKNGNEEIVVEQVILKGDALRMRMPVFESVFEGKLLSEGRWEGIWRDPSRGPNYQIPFVATYGEKSRFENMSTHVVVDSMYEVSFSPDTEDYYPAIGLFRQEGAKVVGTFLTETGDYRYLEGGLQGNKLSLSAFDGSHAFIFEATVEENGDLNGKFFSGNHWKEPWVGKPNPEAKLAEPDKLTYLKDGYEGVSFTFPNASGDSVSFPSARYEGKAVIVQLLGSWCPNCMDETRLFARWYESYNEQGLEIIGLAFERQPQMFQAFQAINYMKNSLGVDYEILLASNSTSKKTAAEKLPMLNKVIAYPTSIFIDKKGKIRAIHAGFNGPATGRLYDEYVGKYEKLVQNMLNE
ncbi:MAG: TlpA family protein disulfide reductase [Bacteroidia bacterium]|nr:TlpA family protein disulfide reductase [Bacteroidia bacterium]